MCHRLDLSGRHDMIVIMKKKHMDEQGLDTRRLLEAILRKPVRSASDARRAREAAGLLETLIEIEDRASRLAGAAAEEGPSYGGDLAGLALQEAARRVLTEAGHPLHARELGARIKARGWRHRRSTSARPDQIVFQLAARLPRFPETFRRVAPNTFALVDFQAQTVRRKPRTGLFSGPGTGIAESTTDSEEPMEASDWRSS